MCWTTEGLAVNTWREPRERWRVKVEEGHWWRMSAIHKTRLCLLEAMEKTEPIIG